MRCQILSSFADATSRENFGEFGGLRPRRRRVDRRAVQPVEDAEVAVIALEELVVAVVGGRACGPLVARVVAQRAQDPVEGEADDREVVRVEGGDRRKDGQQVPRQVLERVGVRRGDRGRRGPLMMDLVDRLVGELV